ncbi:helix-turn-helix domain-containing protein [Aerococcaceae bacterium INB8]|uniref:Helix-turn-helix domain-containing protein n=1 Tax=Ruoffia halotolerans TaxID=2748684 RepID=A0A839A453_9LACT|nr:helix-turn-helix domain-containing protein [Ruoffia halotolerans]
MKETKTYEEKLNIVQDYLNNDLSYRETSEKFKVSYNNVYAWVNIYKKHGLGSLIDSRGRSKPLQY